MLSPVPIRDKMCGAGVKSLKILECGREKLMSVVTTTTLSHSLTTYRGIHGKLRLWSTNNTQLTGFVARGPRASQRCTISKDVESS